MYEEILKWIDEERQRQGLSWRGLEKKAGINYKTMWTWVTFKQNARVISLCDVIEALNGKLEVVKSE